MPNIQEIIKLIESKRKTSFPWEREKRHDQEYYTYSPSSKTWHAVSSAISSSSSSSSRSQREATALTSFRVLSWNIDFMLPHANERMQAALDHVQGLVHHGEGKEDASIIFFNEMLVSDLSLIQAQPWIQQGYNMTDIDNRWWESGHYGTCTLVPKSLGIASVFRVHYEATAMERDALFVDVLVDDGQAVRFCNSHLESLIAVPPVRPRQVKTAARYLLERGGSASAGDSAGAGAGARIIGGVMGGDFNAIQPFDRTLHSDNGLRDAFLELGGKEDAENAYTWGQMAPVHDAERFGFSRMDKIFFGSHGDNGNNIQAVDFQRFGYGVEVKDEKIKKVLMEEEGLRGGWVTDHLGVMAKFKLKISPAGGGKTTRL